jgi:Cu+-exporting ATPase
MAEAPIRFKPRGATNAVVPAAAPVIVLPVEGMDCGGCVQSVQRALMAVRGVNAAIVSLERREASVRLDVAKPASREQLIAAVVAAGYRVPVSPMEVARSGSAEAPANPWRTAVLLGAPVTLALMVAEWALGLGMNRAYHWVAFALALPVQVLAGGKFYRGAWRQLRVGRSNMDTLVALGSTAAFGFSTWALFVGFPGHLYFMEAVGILTLISVGHWIEARMGAKAGESLKALLTLAPATARRRRRATPTRRASRNSSRGWAATPPCRRGSPPSVPGGRPTCRRPMCWPGSMRSGRFAQRC